MRLEQSPDETVLVLQNPGEKEAPAVAIGLGCRVPCDDSWLSFDKLGSDVTQITVTPVPGGATMEVVDWNTADYNFSAQGIKQPSFVSPATIEVSEDWKEFVRGALRQ